MSACVPAGILVLSILVLSACLSGCVSTSVGDAAYRNGTFEIAVANPSDSADAYIQVTVYRIENFRQEETDAFGNAVSLGAGENMVEIPGTIGPGEYKLYIYVIQDGARKTAVIRDIRV
jgi:hypothetical protein